MAQPPLAPATRIEILTPAILAVLVVIAAITLSTVVAAALPVRIGEAQWRFQTLAVFLSAGPQLALLLMLIAGLAVLGRRRATVQTTAIVTIVLAVLLALAVPFFGLDFLTQRHLQSQLRLGAFDREGLRLAGSTAVLVPLLVWAGVRGLAAGRKDPSSEHDVERGIAVTQPGVPES